ncbi:MAG: DUF805 domain-containing protein [Hellea sp.]
MTSFVDAVKSAFQNYANFKGRASRSEFWWFYLFYIIVIVALSFISRIIGETIGGLLSLIFLLAVIVPFIALGARRMHDSDKSGWFQLIPLYNLYLAIIKGTDGPNRFGPDPLGGTGNTFN